MFKCAYCGYYPIPTLPATCPRCNCTLRVDVLSDPLDEVMKATEENGHFLNIEMGTNDKGDPTLGFTLEDRRPIRVVILDDDGLLRRALVRTIRKMDKYEVVDEYGHPDVLLADCTDEWDILITDHEMPGRTGWSVLRALDARQWRKHAILWSGGTRHRQCDVSSLTHMDVRITNKGAGRDALLPLLDTLAEQVYIARRTQGI